MSLIVPVLCNPRCFCGLGHAQFLHGYTSAGLRDGFCWGPRFPGMQQYWHVPGKWGLSENHLRSPADERPCQKHVNEPNIKNPDN